MRAFDPNAWAVSPPLLVALAGILIFVSRHTMPSLAWDDGPVFQAGAATGLASIAQPYGGYFHPVSRSIALLASAAGTWEVAWFASLLIALFVATYVASERMSPILPAPWQRLAAGLAVLVLPGSVQILGLLGQIQWWGEIYLLAWILCGSANPLGLGLAALSGPYSILFAPVVLARRPRGWPIVLAGGLIQTIAFLTSERGSSLELGRFAEVLALRGTLGVFFGQIGVLTIPISLVIAAAVAAGTLGAIAFASDRRLWPVVACALIVAVLGVAFAGESNAQLLAGSGSRYFFGLTFALVLFVVRSPRLPLSWSIAGLLAIGALISFTIPARNFYGWG